MIVSSLSEKQTSLFCNQLASVLKTGISINRALPLASHNFPKPFRLYLKQVVYHLNRGVSLGEALRMNPRFLRSWQIELLDVGSAQGSLILTCELLAKKSEKKRQENKLESTIRFKFLVGMWNIFMALGLFFWPSQSLFNLNFFLSNSLLFLVLWAFIGGVLFFLNRYYQSTLFSVPIIGKIIRYKAMINLDYVNLYLHSGLSILAALEYALTHIEEASLKQQIKKAIASVKRGRSLVKTFDKTLPAIALNLLSMGEETGDLPGAFGKIVEYYEGELNTTLKILKTKIDIFQTLGFGCFVLAVGLLGFRSLFQGLL